MANGIAKCTQQWRGYGETKHGFVGMASTLSSGEYMVKQSMGWLWLKCTEHLHRLNHFLNFRFLVPCVRFGQN